MRLAVLIFTWLVPLAASGGQAQARLEAECPPARDSSRIARDPSIPGVIAGELTNGDSGRPLDGAVIRISPPETLTRTDSVGGFRIEGLRLQRYVVEALIIGYERRFDTVAVTGDAGVRMHLALTPAAVDRCMEIRKPLSPRARPVPRTGSLTDAEADKGFVELFAAAPQTLI